MAKNTDKADGQDAVRETLGPPTPLGKRELAHPETAAPAKQVAAAKEEVSSDLDDNFPVRDQLIAAGLNTKAKVKACGDLTAIKGIRSGDVTPIRKACGYPGSTHAR